MRQLPRTIGIRRVQKSSRLHKEVIRNLDKIAAAEDKSFSYVVAEIVYKFFGLEIKDNIVKVKRKMRQQNVIQFRKRA